MQRHLRHTSDQTKDREERLGKSILMLVDLAANFAFEFLLKTFDHGRSKYERDQSSAIDHEIGHALLCLSEEVPIREIYVNRLREETRRSFKKVLGSLGKGEGIISPFGDFTFLGKRFNVKSGFIHYDGYGTFDSEQRKVLFTLAGFAATVGKYPHEYTYMDDSLEEREASKWDDIKVPYRYLSKRASTLAGRAISHEEVKRLFKIVVDQLRKVFSEPQNARIHLLLKEILLPQDALEKAYLNKAVREFPQNESLLQILSTHGVSKDDIETLKAQIDSISIDAIIRDTLDLVF